ncbi:FAD-dependent oxidoreductase [Fulvivirgaceae bacterium BMA12]|uniref:FAD-dependent oxidoreductase n=1 Tax=Agaribacillus aureus TaxID=3051825 RepID=A0ABT8L457_9BACT|nr:FAD-dependent oxidoreductase [Fulvivirgaceae bacterium BMA12]
MLSFWEKRSLTSYNYIVIGGGIVGLSTAISIRERCPEAKILVLERGVFPSGASTKNAGFACFGSLTELMYDIKNMGEEQTLTLVRERWLGLRQLRARLGEENIDYQNHGGYELLRENELDALNSLEEINRMLAPLFETDVFTERKDFIASFGFNRHVIKSIIYNPFEGQIDTGKMMASLMAFARSAGIDLLTGAEVISFEEKSNGVEIQVKNLQNLEPICFQSDYLAICTNAFARSLLPALKLNPGRGQVLITSPIKGLTFKGVFHFDQGYYYFRNLGERIIFGGGRNLDFQGETSEEFGITRLIMDNLLQKLKEIIIPTKDFAVEHQWSGIMAFGENKMPLLEKISDRVVVGVRLGGMGVAIGSRLGDHICELIVPT